MKDFAQLFSSFDLIDEIIYICDMDTYDLVYCNMKAKTILTSEYRDNEPGFKCYKCLQNLDHPCVFCNNDELRLSKRCVWMRMHPLSGRHFLLHDSIVTVDGHDYRMELAVDATVVEDSVERTRRKLEVENHLTDCVRGLVRSDDFEDSVDAVLQTILAYYSGERAYIFDFDWQKGTSSNTFEMCAQGVSPEIDNLQDVPVEVMSFWIDHFAEQSAMVIEDLEAIKDDPARADEYDTLAPQGINSLIAVPFYASDELSGFIGVDNPRVHFENTEFITDLAYFIGTEIEKRKNFQSLAFMNLHDRMSGVLNRNAYSEVTKRLEDYPPRTCGVAFVDMNGLKYLNDTFGHEAGDQKIRQLGELLVKHCSVDDVFRISGDEFVVVEANVASDDFNKRMLLLKEDLGAAHGNLAALGFVWDDSGVPLKTLRMQAEQLMYSEKHKHYLFDEDVQRSVRPKYVDEVLGSLLDGKYDVYLQPEYSLETGRVCGAEALARKIEPDGRVIRPFEFITALENEHAISFVDFFVFEKVCRTLKRWEESGCRDLTVSTNFSRNTIAEPDFCDHILSTCERVGVDCSRLMIEVTESSNSVHMERLTEVMQTLRRHGFRFALDDMGTEYATLQMLELAEIDLVKFDRSLIRRVEDGSRSQTVLRKLVELCHTLGMGCIAEGVEKPGQLEAVKEAGCELVQGYLIDKPMPIDEFESKYVAGPAD